MNLNSLWTRTLTRVSLVIQITTSTPTPKYSSVTLWTAKLSCAANAWAYNYLQAKDIVCCVPWTKILVTKPMKISRARAKLHRNLNQLSQWKSINQLAKSLVGTNSSNTSTRKIQISHLWFKSLTTNMRKRCSPHSWFLKRREPSTK